MQSGLIFSFFAVGQQNRRRIIKEPGEEEDSGYYAHVSQSASCTRHWSQRSRLLYHCCPRILPPPPPPPSISPLLMSGHFSSRDIYARERQKKRHKDKKEREREWERVRGGGREQERRNKRWEVVFLDRSHVTSSLKPRGRGLSYPRRVNHSFSLPLSSSILLLRSLFLEPVPRTLPCSRLSTCSLLPGRVLHPSIPSPPPPLTPFGLLFSCSPGALRRICE